MSGAAAGETTKENILRISAELFARNGYHATGMAELSEAVGRGRGALYYHIGSKEALLFDISKAQVDRMNKVAEQILGSDAQAPKKLRELARALTQNIAEHRSEWTVFFREFTALTGERREEVLQARETYEGAWRRVLREGVHEGTFRRTQPVLLKGILGMFNYSYLWLEPDGKLTPRQVADVFVDNVLTGLAAGQVEE